MQRSLSLLAGLVLALALATPVFADGMQQVVGADSRSPVWTVTVFNDSGGALTSGDLVVWDQADTDFTSEGNPYVTTTTTADDPWTAGIMQTGTCPDQALCEIVVYGIAENVLVDDSGDNAAVDTLVGASATNATNLGDYATGANTCAVGTLLDFVGPDSRDNTMARVFVDVDCD